MDNYVPPLIHPIMSMEFSRGLRFWGSRHDVAYKHLSGFVEIQDNAWTARVFNSETKKTFVPDENFATQQVAESWVRHTIQALSSEDGETGIST